MALGTGVVAATAGIRHIQSDIKFTFYHGQQSATLLTEFTLLYKRSSCAAGIFEMRGHINL